MKRKSGFSLIELLFVILILGTVMTVIMASFAGGFRVYDRIRTFGSREMDIYLTCEAIAIDLKNSHQTESIPFNGARDAIEMLTTVPITETAPRQAIVRYETVPAGIQRTLTALDPAGGPATTPLGTETILPGDFRMVLQYQGLEQGQGWRETWPVGTNLPLAVRIEIADQAQPEGAVMRTVILETSGHTMESP